MSTGLKLASQKYYQEAKKMLEQKDLLEFISNISIAIESGDNAELLAEATYLKVKGLFNFKQYKKALASIPQALQYNTGEKALRLKNYEGVISGYLGELKSAESIFIKLLDQIEDTSF